MSGLKRHSLGISQLQPSVPSKSAEQFSSTDELLEAASPALLLDFSLSLEDEFDESSLLLDSSTTLMSEDEELRVTEEEDSFLTLEDDFAELLLDLVLLLDSSAGSGTFEELLDFGMTLDEDFLELLLNEDSPSQSSHTLEDESSEGRVTEPLSSSPQATNIAAQTKTPSQRERIFPPIICIKNKKMPYKGKPVSHKRLVLTRRDGESERKPECKTKK
jgi:hypothetical protein